jgi:hypothetical protein
LIAEHIFGVKIRASSGTFNGPSGQKELSQVELGSSEYQVALDRERMTEQKVTGG